MSKTRYTLVKSSKSIGTQQGCGLTSIPAWVIWYGDRLIGEFFDEDQAKELFARYTGSR